MSSKKLLINATNATQPGETETTSLVIRPTSASGTSWQNTQRVYDGNNSQAATVSITSSNYSNRYLTVNFSDINIPENAHIELATLTIIAKQSSSNTSRRITVQVDLNGDSSSRVINQQLTSTSNVTLTADIGPYIRDLNSLKITGMTSGTSYQSQTFSIYEVFIDVTYTIQNIPPEPEPEPEQPSEDGWTVIGGSDGHWSDSGFINELGTVTTDLIYVGDLGSDEGIYIKMNYKDPSIGNPYDIEFLYFDTFDISKKFIEYESIALTNDATNGTFVYPLDYTPEEVKYIAIESIREDSDTHIADNVIISYKKASRSTSSGDDGWTVVNTIQGCLDENTGEYYESEISLVTDFINVENCNTMTISVKSVSGLENNNYVYGIMEYVYFDEGKNFLGSEVIHAEMPNGTYFINNISSFDCCYIIVVLYLLDYNNQEYAIVSPHDTIVSVKGVGNSGSGNDFYDWLVVDCHNGDHNEEDWVDPDNQDYGHPYNCVVTTAPIYVPPGMGMAIKVLGNNVNYMGVGLLSVNYIDSYSDFICAQTLNTAFDSDFSLTANDMGYIEHEYISLTLCLINDELYPIAISEDNVVVSIKFI